MARARRRSCAHRSQPSLERDPRLRHLRPHRRERGLAGRTLPSRQSRRVPARPVRRLGPDPVRRAAGHRMARPEAPRRPRTRGQAAARILGTDPRPRHGTGLDLARPRQLGGAGLRRGDRPRHGSHDPRPRLGLVAGNVRGSRRSSRPDRAGDMAGRTLGAARHRRPIRPHARQPCARRGREGRACRGHAQRRARRIGPDRQPRDRGCPRLLRARHQRSDPLVARRPCSAQLFRDDAPFHGVRTVSGPARQRASGAVLRDTTLRRRHLRAPPARSPRATTPRAPSTSRCSLVIRKGESWPPSIPMRRKRRSSDASS